MRASKTRAIKKKRHEKKKKMRTKSIIRYITGSAGVPSAM
jgi:hypothetical protein